MADQFTDPFGSDDPATGPGNLQSAAAEWTSALAKPEVRGALLQFGINMLQPPGFGQTTAGKVGEAIGASGEYLTRQDEEARKEREQTRKEADTESLGTYRQDQAEIGGIKAQAARQNAESLGLLRQSQITISQHKAALVDAQVENLTMKTKMAPEDQATKAALAQAKQDQLAAHAELDRQRAAYVPATVENTTKRIEAGDRKVKADDVRTQLKIDAQDRRTYESAKAAHTKREEYSRTKTPFPDFDTWRASTGGRDTRTPTPTTSTPTPAPTTEPVKDIASEIEKAKGYIAAGKDPAAVRRLFKERTGQDLP